MRSRTLTAALLGTTLLLSACGGGDDGPTKAEYVAKADAICKKEGDASDAKAQQQAAAFGESPTPEQLTTIVSETVLPGIERQLTQLKALDEPKDGADDVEALLSSLDGALQKAKADPSALTQESSGLFDDANKRADALGLKVCGRG